MPRHLKTFQTSLGFFDLAVAAPSMKAALEAWGSSVNLFHQGFARETNDPGVVIATMKQPGVVLKRAVGSNAQFSEHAELPKSLPAFKVKERVSKAEPSKAEKPKQKRGKKSADIVSFADERAARRAAEAYDREHERQERERRKEEGERERVRHAREQLIAKAEAALERAKAIHDAALHALEEERAQIDKRIDAEKDRWERQKGKLDVNLRQAHD